MRSQVIRETFPALEALGACDGGCWLWPSITQRSYETAELLSSLLGVGRNRIVPEYSFLDSRCSRPLSMIMLVCSEL